MSSPFNPIQPNKNEGELTKKIIRSISDVVRHLDDARGRAQTIAELFVPSFEVQRSKLHELCYRLILLDPENHGRRGEDALWKKGYHDVFTTAKRIRKDNSWSAEEAAQVRGLLVSGVGYYHHLLLKLQSDHSIDMEFCQDFSLHVADHGLSKGKPVQGRSEKATRSKALSGRVLVYLGDLSRYLKELEPTWDPGLAERYYRQALAVDPTQGRPYNQLGTLAGGDCYGIHAAYYYLRSLNSNIPFPGALGNVTNVVERTAATIDSTPVAKLISAVLHAVGGFFCEKPVDLAAITTQILEGFRTCVKTSAASSTRPELTDFHVPPQPDLTDILPPEYTLKLMAVLIMCAEKHAESDHWACACSILVPCFAHLVQVLAPRRLIRPRRRRRLRRQSSSGDSDGSSGAHSAASDSSDDQLPAPIEGSVTLEDELFKSLCITLYWLRGRPTALSDYADYQPLLRTFITLLNSASNLMLDFSTEEGAIKTPLSEDVEMKGLSGLHSAEAELDWSLGQLRSPHEETEIRCRRIVATAQHLPNLLFDATQNEFMIQTPAPGRCKGELMKHMGQLWLQAEVRELETRTRKAPPGLSPYVVVDAEALVAHAPLVKHLVGSRQFVVVIPAVVLQILDDWKRESGRSRESIRWLESQFQRGNRSLRAQKAHERLALPLIKYPKKKEKDSWNLFQVMECCYYLSKQSSLLVTLLTGAANTSVPDSRTSSISPAGVANTFGVSVEPMDAFYNKWKASSTSKNNAQT